jgi:O-antigen ligase
MYVQGWDNYKIINILLVILFGILLFLTQFACYQLFESGYFSYAAIFIVGILASAILVIQSIRADSTLLLNSVDLSFIAFTLLLFLRLIGSSDYWIYSKASVAFAIIPIYFFVRQYKWMHHIHWAMVFVGIIQIAVAILQKSGILTNINTSFEVGGTVGNPNILAMLLLLSLPSAIFLFHTAKLSILKRLIITYILMALSIIAFTQCRSAIIGCIVIGIFFLFINKRQSIKQRFKLFWVGILGLAVLGFSFLIFEKSDSLIGRLLIWQSCFVKIIEKPFWGHGVSTFHQVYPEAQRVFLEKNSNSTYLKLADSPQWAYNDFIELWLEGGIFTTMAFGMILISVLYCWKTQKRFNINRNNIAYLSVLVFFLLSAFNFAFTAWPILLIFVISLAWSARISQNILKIRLKSKLNLWLFLALLLFFGNILLGIDANKNLIFQHQLKEADTMSISMQRNFYSQSKEKYGFYAPFIIKYAGFLRREEEKAEAIKVLLRLNNHARSYQTNYQLAEAYSELYDFKNAKLFYNQSLKYLPNRIMPLFNLFMIERTEKNFKNADSIRNKILQSEFKGDKMLVRQIKESINDMKYNKITTDIAN